MLYRESGQFKTSYKADMAIFPIRQDRWGVIMTLILAVVIVPLFASEHMIVGYLIPFLIWSMPGHGTGRCVTSKPNFAASLSHTGIVSIP